MPLDAELYGFKDLREWTTGTGQGIGVGTLPAGLTLSGKDGNLSLEHITNKKPIGSCLIEKQNIRKSEVSPHPLPGASSAPLSL